LRTALFRVRKQGILLWWSLVAIVVAVPLLLFGLYYWASEDPGVEREDAKERFRAEQESRWLRRSSEDAGTPTRNYK